MNKLISLEVKRNRLRPYHIAVLIGGFTLLAFHYFMAAIPLIDPTEGDIAMFSSYDFLFNLNHLVSMAIFGILGAVMGTRFVIEEYSGAKAVLLFSYPISRKKMMGAKLWLVFCYPVAAMLLCGIVIGGVFFFTESLFPLCADNLTWETIGWAFLSLLFHSLLAGAVAFLSIWIGLLKKSIPVTIVAAVIAATILCQVLSAAFSFRPVLFILLGVAAILTMVAVRSMFYQVENMEV